MNEDEPKNPLDLARQLLFVASHFAGAALETCQQEFPAETVQLVQSHPVLAVRISEITSPLARVALVRVIDSVDYELFHVDLQTAPAPGSLMN